MISKMQMSIAITFVLYSGTTVATGDFDLSLPAFSVEYTDAYTPLTQASQTARSSNFTTDENTSETAVIFEDWFLLKSYDEIHFSLQKAFFDIPAALKAGAFGVGFSPAWNPTEDQNIENHHGPVYMNYSNVIGTAWVVDYTLPSELRIALISASYKRYGSLYNESWQSSTALYIGTSF